MAGYGAGINPMTWFGGSTTSPPPEQTATQPGFPTPAPVPGQTATQPGSTTQPVPKVSPPPVFQPPIQAQPPLPPTTPAPANPMDYFGTGQPQLGGAPPAVGGPRFQPMDLAALFQQMLANPAPGWQQMLGNAFGLPPQIPATNPSAPPGWLGPPAPQQPQPPQPPPTPPKANPMDYFGLTQPPKANPMDYFGMGQPPQPPMSAPKTPTPAAPGWNPAWGPMPAGWINANSPIGTGLTEFTPPNPMNEWGYMYGNPVPWTPPPTAWDPAWGTMPANWEPSWGPPLDPWTKQPLRPGQSPTTNPLGPNG